MSDKLKPEAGGSSRAQTQGAAVKYSMFWHLMGHFDIWTQQWKVCERQQRWAEQHTQDVVRSPRLAWAGARAGASKWNRQVRKRHRQTWRPQMFFIIGCEMPAWDRDHPQDGGSGLQSPATAAQGGRQPENNSSAPTRRRWGRTWERWRWPAEPHGPNCACRARRLCVFVFGCLWGEALNFFWVPTLYAAQICSRWENIDKMDQRLLAKVLRKHIS